MQLLDSAYRRVERAGRHLTNLNRRVNAFRQSISDAVVLECKPQRFQFPDGRIVDGVLASATIPANVPVPPTVTILVGEVVYNLRASLDYLVYDLAMLDSGKVVEGTQFPIDDTERSFRNRRIGFLRGLSDDHVATIETLQPFYGCNWTKVLRDISNPDKHRHLTIVRHPVTISPAEGSTAAIIAGQPVDVRKDISVNIAFRGGLPVVETFRQLKLEVAKTLDAFKSELERSRGGGTNEHSQPQSTMIELNR